ncbi:MAG: hypothetical protein ACPGYV_01410 [Phycisphaeraceae bacterium]
MRDLSPPVLETFGHWPSWLNARGHIDRSACFELKVSELRRISGCIPMQMRRGDMTGKAYRAKGRQRFGLPDLPNERPAPSTKGRISCGWYDLSPREMDHLARQQFPRRLAGDWRTARAPAMRPRFQKLRPKPSRNAATDEATGTGDDAEGTGPSRRCSTALCMDLTQGGYGPGSYAYERRSASGALDRGLEGNPNRGATREKRFGLDVDWVQRLGLEKWEHNSVSGVQYFLICPGATRVGGPGDAPEAMRSTVDAKGLKGLTGTTSNCGDGSRGAHGQGWVCGQRVYKLFWVLGRAEEHRDALLAKRWIAGLDSGQLSRASSAVSALIDRYGPIMGDDRLLRCRRCLRLRYGQSPEVLRRKRRARRGDRSRPG